MKIFLLKMNYSFDLDYSSQSYLNMNLYPTLSITPPIINPKKSSSTSPDVQIAQLAKQMAYERMLEEIQSQRQPNNHKKSKNFVHPPSTLTESIQVNHLLHDVMMKILHEIYDKQQQQAPVPTPRASRKGELLFVKKQNVNNDEQYNFIENHKKVSVGEEDGIREE